MDHWIAKAFVNESLAGRVAIIDLLGLSKAEIENRKKVYPFLPTNQWLKKRSLIKKYDINHIYKQIWQGSFPKVVKMSAKNRSIYYTSYVKTYIQRDIKDYIGIRDDVTFYNFIRATACRTGEMLNYADLARDVSIDLKTAKSWIGALQFSGLIYLLYPWHSSLSKRFVKTPKIYFLDTGLACHLTKWIDYKALVAGAFSGSILETWIITELLKSYWHNGLEANFYYYGDNDQREIDLIIESSNKLYPVEIKKTASPKVSKVFPLLKKSGKNVDKGAMLCFAQDHFPISKSVNAVPISYL